jgi:hypothetical protein
MRQSSCLLVASLLAPALGCSPPASEATKPPPSAIPQDNKSGSRIHLLHWSSDDGADGAQVFWDTTLGAECRWIYASDEKYHCLPRDNVFYYPARFADSECTRPVFTHAITACGAPPAYLRSPTENLTCPTASVLRRLGQRLAGREYFFHAVDGTCASVPHRLRADEELYEFGEEVPVSDFVAGSLRMGTVREKFAALLIEGEDGSRGLFGYRDLKGGFDCAVSVAADGMLRCLPFTVGTTGAFVDESCSMSAGLGSRFSCQPARSFLAESRANACGRRTSIFKAGERLSSGYEMFPDGCSTDFASVYLDYWTSGLQVDPATFVPAASSIMESSRRLRAQVVTTPAGAVPSGALWDAKLGVDCSPWLLADGTYRCVSFPLVSTASLNTFADDQCTMPVAPDLGSSVAGRCSATYGFSADAAVCPLLFHLFAIEKAPFKGVVFTKNGGACVATPASPTPVHLVGPEVDPAEFVELHPPAP